jgi:hypothetical protein
MDEADNATLAFFTNPAYLGMLQRKLTPLIKDDADLKFYRKRIISLFKDLCKEQASAVPGEAQASEAQASEAQAPAQTAVQQTESAPAPVNQELKEAYRRFVAAAIKHFEMVDKKDIVQGQHTAAGGHTSAAGTCASTADADASTPEDILNEIGGGDADYTPTEANALMMRKTLALPNLDNYVISKPDLSTNNVRIIPMKLDFDLKAPELKTKGLKPKVKKIKEEKKSKNAKEELSQ